MDGFLECLGGPDGIDVLDPEQQAAARLACELAVEQRRIGVAEMQRSVRAGRKSEYASVTHIMLTKRVGRVTSRLLLCPPGKDKPDRDPTMQRIETLEHVRLGLDALCAADGRLHRVRDMAGEVPLRLSEPGFRSLASIVVSQQVSRASAEAIFGRLARLVDPLTADGILAAGEAVFREAGLSRPKQAALLAIAEAVAREGLDLNHLCGLEPAEAMRALTAIHGVGAWTAEVYLLFAAGHPDIFPARDVALQTAVGHALAIDPRPGEKALIRVAESWSPWRGVAARLFWAYYRETRGRDAAPVLQES
jgi:DNA-3-methyladenine glycosylase II